MATGDNVLTAISVAAQCQIIDKAKPTYLGDLSVDEATNMPFIMWQRENAHSEDAHELDAPYMIDSID